MSNGITQADLRELTWGWWLVLLVGVLSVIAGVIVLTKPAGSLVTLAAIIGIFILVDGIFELAVSLSRRTPNRGMAALVGALSVIVGILLVRDPIAGVAAVALLIGIWLAAVGVVRLVAAFAEVEHRVWNIVVAVVEVIAGVVIVASPDIGFATLALLAGIGFILKGFAMCVLGWSMRAVHDATAA